MVTQKTRELRSAIENLMNAKLLDILAQPNRLARLNVQRCSPEASKPIHRAEQQLDEMLSVVFVKTHEADRLGKSHVRSGQTADAHRPSLGEN